MSREAKKIPKNCLGGFKPPHRDFVPLTPAGTPPQTPLSFGGLGKFFPDMGYSIFGPRGAAFVSLRPVKTYWSQSGAGPRERGGSGLNCPPFSDFSLENLHQKGKNF